MVIGDEIPLAWIYALLAALVIVGIYTVSPDAAITLAILFSGIYIASRFFEFKKEGEEGTAIIILLFGLLFIGYGLSHMGTLKQVLFQGASGLTIESADYLPYAYASSDFTKTNLKFDKAWLVKFRLSSSGGQYVLTRNDLYDKEDKVAARDSMIIYGYIRFMRCVADVEEKSYPKEYHRLNYKIVKGPVGWSPEDICKYEGNLPTTVFAYTLFGHIGFFHKDVICIYKEPYKYFQVHDIANPGYEANVHFKINKGTESDTIEINMRQGPDYFVGKSKNGKVGILIYNDQIQKNSKFSCNALNKIVPVHKRYGGNTWWAIGYPDLFDELDHFLAFEFEKKVEDKCVKQPWGAYHCSEEDIREIVNEYNELYERASCNMNCEVSGLPVKIVSVINGKVETFNIPESLYSIPGLMFIDAKWLGIIQSIVNPKLVYFDGNSYSNKVYFEPMQSKSIKVKIKNENSIGGTIRIYLDDCDYLSGEKTTSIGPSETKEYSLIVKASSYKLKKGKDKTCRICVESYSAYIPVPGYKKNVDCKTFYYHLKPSCRDKCKPGTYKCLDKYTSGYCELQPNGCYDYTPIECPNGCDYATGRCKSKPQPPQPPVCGNGICEPGETPENCPQDCGQPPKECPNCFAWLRGKIAKFIGGEAVTMCKPKEIGITLFGFKIFSISQDIYCPIFILAIIIIILIVMIYFRPIFEAIIHILRSVTEKITKTVSKRR
ncbi:MAG: hypothetical protein J7L07_00185 [Candidatus Odinarchaeota archaeon]|nr:hypothetical protein [Candidatus Odinarchaeota archaeon]